MLLTDGLVNTIEEIASYDNSVLNVASTEGINIAQKMTIAQGEIETCLLIFLMRSGCQDPKFLVRRSVECSDVVVTASLKRWHAYKSLAGIYQDAFSTQLNDRYRGKWMEYEALARSACTQHLEAGVGIVGHAVPKAQAPVTAGPQDGIGQGYYVRVTWVNEWGQEGAPSEAVQAGDNNVIGPVQAIGAPAGVSGWNVYVGDDPQLVWRQNAAPMAIAEGWTAEASALLREIAAGTGQAAERFVCETRTIQRG